MGAPESFPCYILSSVTIFFFFKKKSCQGRELRAEMLGYGVKREAGAAAEAPRSRPEAERNSQERAAHYPALWLPHEGADSWRRSLHMFTHGKKKIGRRFTN